MNEKIGISHGGNLFEIERNFGLKKESILDFSGNINPLGVPNSLRNSIIKNIDLIGFYPDPDYVAVKEAIGQYVNLDSKYITLGNGATELISKTFKIIQPKKALTLMPTYSEYEKEIFNLGGKLDYLKLKEADNFEIIPSKIKEELKKGYDLLILCNPNNPTSTSLTNAQIEDIAANALDAGTFIIIDETYVEFCDNADEISSAKIINEYDNIFIIRGISKFFGTPGLRLGYGLSSNSNLIEKINEDSNPWFINIFAAKAAETVFKDTEYINNTKNLMREEKEFLYKNLSSFKNLKVYKPYTNFILCRLIDDSISSLELSHKLLDESILIRDTNNVFGLDDSYFRVCVLDRNSNLKLISCLGKYLK